MLEVRATGVCRSDWHGWKGHDGDVIAHGLPFTPGHEVSGVVVERGAGVSAGNRRTRRRAIHPLVRLLPRVRPRARDHLRTAAAAGIHAAGELRAIRRAAARGPEPARAPGQRLVRVRRGSGCRFTTAFRAVVQQGRLRAGETLAVFGCGGLGLSAVMIGAATGARVVAVDPSRRGAR